MDNKLHIKAIANHNIKVDAYHYKYGDEMDCYVSPQYFKDLIMSDALLDFDIIIDNNPKSINADYKVIEEEVVNNEQIQNTDGNEIKGVRKSTKKTVS